MTRASSYRYLSSAAILLAGAAAWAAAPTPPAAAPTGAAAATRDNAANASLAAMLANDARDTLRNPDLPADAAAVEAAILLKFSVELDGSDLHVQRLLAETAQAAGMHDLRRDTLRKIIKADPGDLVSQVRYIDLLAGESQTFEDRARIYQSALDQAGFDDQIRSEMALRLGRLFQDRGDLARTRDYLGQSLKLNGLNVEALSNLAALAAGDDSPEGQLAHMRALTALLTANPYRSDAWYAVAMICERNNLFERAAEFLQTYLEQAQLDGLPIDIDTLVDLAIAQAISGRRGEAYRNITALAQNPDAPLAALLVSELLSQDVSLVPGATGEPAASQPEGKMALEIRRRLAEMVKGGTPQALADAIGVDLTMLRTVGTDTQAWLDDYAKQVPADDPTLARLRGWMLFRQDKPAEAAALFEKIPGDPLAQLGRVRILVDKGDKAAATRLLNDVYATYPTGLLALQVTRLAQNARITLSETDRAKAMRLAAAALTPAVTGMFRQPRDLLLMNISYRKESVGVGEPVIMTIRMTNVGNRALPVGPAGVVKTTIGLADTTRGAKRDLLGIFALEDVQRAYRLEPHAILETQLRVDQGKLADLFEQEIGATQSVGVTVVTAPLVIDPTHFSTGVGGQMVTPGNFDRAGLVAAAASDSQRLVNELTSMNGEKLLPRIAAAGVLMRKGGGGKDLTDALTKLAASSEVPIRAAVARVFVGVDLTTDGEPLVRLLAAARRAGQYNSSSPSPLDNMSAMEKNESVKAFIDAALRARPTTPLPTSAPAPTSSAPAPKGN